MKNVQRCEWGNFDPLLTTYHDQEWGVPVHDDRKLFEMLNLEGAQAGLSWLTILKKRDSYRKAFDNFDASKIATYDAAKRAELLTNEGIIRNRLKVNAFIENARAYLKVKDEFGSFNAYVWQFVDNKPRVGGINRDTVSAVSKAMSKDMKKRGFRFVGPTTVLAFMQAVGVVNDHESSCYRTNQKYTTIFFDWGGVIANDPGDDFLSQLLRSIGATETQVQEIFETYMKRFMRGQITEAEYWQELRTTYGFTIHDSISHEFTKWRGLKANDSILALAKEAKGKGLNIAILSNVIEPTYNVIEQAGYYSLFDEVIASCKVGYVKPEKEIYKIALDRFGVTAEESVFIDDKQYCLDPAASMGFKTILAKNPEQIIGDIRACWS